MIKSDRDEREDHGDDEYFGETVNKSGSEPLPDPERRHKDVHDILRPDILDDCDAHRLLAAVEDVPEDHRVDQKNDDSGHRALHHALQVHRNEAPD